jgi:hypothetical protein
MRAEQQAHAQAECAAAPRAREPGRHASRARGSRGESTHPLARACSAACCTPVLQVDLLYGRRFCAGDNSHNSDFAPSRTHVQFSLRHGIFGSSKLSAAARRTREVRCVSQGYPDFSKFDSFVCSSSCCRCSCCCKTSWHTTIHAIPLCGQRATARRTCAGHLCATMHRETHPV